MSESHTSAAAGHVVIAGGGVAALECVMALRDLAGDRVTLTLVAPEPDFVFRPMTVAEPFGFGEALRLPLERFAQEFGAQLVRAHVIAVDPAAKLIVRAGDEPLSYGTLVVAVGARGIAAFSDAITFGARGSAEAMRDVVADLEHGTVRRIAFVVPSLTGWSLPLYELALLTARVARSSGRGTAELYLVTPEAEPLEIFGPAAGIDVADRLERLGIEFVGGTYAAVGGGFVVPHSGRMLEVDRVVALPLMRGPQLAGLPAEPDYGFIPTDEHGRVTGLEDVYAAGDATDFPIKQGGLATQQADAVARHIAAGLGADVDPEPFRPVLRGRLFTAGERFFQVGLGEHPGARPAAESSLWWPPTKIAGRYLAPYLAEQHPGEAAVAPLSGFTEFEVPVGELRLPSEPYDPVGPGSATVS